MKLSVDDLDKIREKMKRVVNLRGGTARVKVTVHMGTCGIASGARDIMSTLLDLVGASGRDDIMLTSSGCAGLCSHEPMITVETDTGSPVKYIDLNPEKTRQIFEQHVIAGSIVAEYALSIGNERAV